MKTIKTSNKIYWAPSDFLEVLNKLNSSPTSSLTANNKSTDGLNIDEITGKKIMILHRCVKEGSNTTLRLKEIADNILSGKWDRHPFRQRPFTWKDSRQIPFITTLLKNCIKSSTNGSMAIAPIFITKNIEDKTYVDDGWQRSSTIHRFVYGNLEIKGYDAAWIIGFFIFQFIECANNEYHPNRKYFVDTLKNLHAGNFKKLVITYKNLPESVKNEFDDLVMSVRHLIIETSTYDFETGKITIRQQDLTTESPLWEWFVNVQLGQEAMTKKDVIMAIQNDINYKTIDISYDLSTFFFKDSYQGRMINQSLIEALLCVTGKAAMNNTKQSIDYLNKNRFHDSKSPEMLLLQKLDWNVRLFYKNHSNRFNDCKFKMSLTDLKFYWYLLLSNWDKLYSTNGDVRFPFTYSNEINKNYFKFLEVLRDISGIISKIRNVYDSKLGKKPSQKEINEVYEYALTIGDDKLKMFTITYLTSLVDFASLTRNTKKFSAFLKNEDVKLKIDKIIDCIIEHYKFKRIN